MDIASVIDIKPNPNIPELNAGDSVKVSIKVVEGDKERIQVFQGVVIRLTNSGGGPIVTVRRASYGVGVERAFPMNSPRVEKIELVRRGKARRARLYYLRGLSAKASRIKERREVDKETPEQTAMAETASTPKPE
ncbi:MAG: 50S ribosomal protein L19 [Dehalococcoidales bacterium]|nr:50S ribosomal protein L19 [Dehalococcoidales bacterium]